MANIPAVSRLLQGLGGLKPEIPASSATTTSTKTENAKNDFLVNKMSHKSFHRNHKKAVHDMLHRLLNAYAEQQLKQDSKTAKKLKSRDKSGSFKISDGPVSGAGVYSISRDLSDIEIDLKIKVNDQQQQQRKQQPSQLPSREQQHHQKPPTLQPQKQQQQRQQRKPQPPPTPQQLQKPQMQQQKQQPQQKPSQQQQISTTPVPPQPVTTNPKMCLAPCSVSQAPQNTNCMAIGM